MYVEKLESNIQSDSLAAQYNKSIGRTTGKWKAIIGKNPYYDADRASQFEWMEEYIYDWVYDGRNYALFALLADVRNNGYITPISDPRGLPSDISETVSIAASAWEGDGHSYSYFTLEELLAFDWDEEYTEHGIVSEREYIEYMNNRKPSSWCGGVSGRMVSLVSNETMNKIISGEIERTDGISYYTDLSWTETYTDMCRDFIDNTLSELRKLGEPNEVRIVFWFDN